MIRKKKKITYKSAGVDIAKADSLIGSIKEDIDSTKSAGSMGSVGGFGGFFDISKARIKDPVLVSSTDGVGTKLKLAQMAGKHDTVGIDLVAMCVNDILCCGAKPLFFLDYIACGKLEEETYKALISGIAEGCRQAGCALTGGETAEMPGMYKKGEYDLAGFSVGAVNRSKIIDEKKMKEGDALLALASSGLHSNGFSLVRKLFTKEELKKNISLFLEPTRIYVKPVRSILSGYTVKGIAHITGGGIYENVKRIIPDGMDAVVDAASWEVPEVFKRIFSTGRLDEKEMYRTFNMGAGMVLVLPHSSALKAQKRMKEQFGLKSSIIGRTVAGSKNVIIKEKNKIKVY